MDSSPEKKSNNIPIPALTSLLFASLAFLVQQFIPLESPRPKTPGTGHSTFEGIQDVNARLWQDPFTALSEHDLSLYIPEQCPSQPLSHHDVKALACSINHHRKTGDIVDKPITVLGVMVFAGPYAENLEFRRRTRYAVLSGLAVKNYYPEDAEHIGYFENNRLSKSSPQKVPFEWFNAGKEGSPILVLWLDETAFGSEPLKKARELVTLLEEETIKAENSDIANIAKLNFKFIGPGGSATLQAMVDEISAASENKEPDRLAQTDMSSDNKNDLIRYLKNQPFEFYDASATGDWPGLTFPAGNRNKTLHAYLMEQDLASLLTRVSLTDNLLALTIADELKLRGFKIDSECVTQRHLKSCRENKYHIALISEWDTLYGRETLPKAMKMALVPWFEKCITQMHSEQECSPEWIQSFSYMRGLDGIVPGEEKTAEEIKSNKDNDKNNRFKPQLERPEGQSQKDYLRRLAMLMSDMERHLNTKGENIGAIGVLGSDAYDKLMILKALKPAFPKAIFFTTDLDTRLNYFDDFDVTRNLIVSASFGLRLENNYQKAIPPFRDSYQTAFFLATQIALDNTKEAGKTYQEHVNQMLKPVRLFETGLTKVIELEVDNCSRSPNCESYHPLPINRAWPDLKRILAGCFALFLILVIAAFLSELCRKLFGKAKRFIKRSIVFDLYLFWPKPVRTRMWRRKWVLMRMLVSPQLLLLAVLGVIGYEISLGGLGEPFYWNEGISIWPTEIIRLFTGILGCIFIASISNAVERNKKNLSKKYFYDDYLTSYNDEKRKKEHDGLRIKYGKSWVFVSALWNWYCLKTSPRLRYKRIILTSGLSVLLGFSLLFIFGFPNTPYRGEASLLANRLVLLFCVPVFIVLVMTVVDATWRSVEMITRLSQSISIWPKATLRQFGLRHDLTKEEMMDEGAIDKLRNELRRQDKYHLDEWIDIQFIAAHTKAIGTLIYYPFIILVLMIFSRSKIFDNWDLPIGLILIFVLNGGLTLASALYLRRAAERTRQTVYGQINDMLIELSSRPEAAARILEKQVTIALHQIQNITEGAFRPISQEPAVQAFLLPFGGWGGITLLEYIVLNGF